MKNTTCNNGNIHLIGLQKFHSEISESASEALNNVSEILKYSKNIDIAIFDAEEWDIHPKLSLSGHARVYYIDIKICFYKKGFDIAKLISIDLPSTIFHEFAHVVRANTVGYAETLLEDFIEEGVTCFVEESFKPDQKIPYIQEQANELEFLKQTQSIFSEKLTSKLHNEWFFGSENIPEWMGYRIGYLIVKSFMEKNKVSLDILVRTKASEIFEKSNYNN